MNNEAIKKIADTYGYDAQSRQLIEEMAELTQAINKHWRKQLECGKRTPFETRPEGFKTAILVVEEPKCVNCDECEHRSEDCLCDISNNEDECPLIKN